MFATTVLVAAVAQANFTATCVADRSKAWGYLAEKLGYVCGPDGGVNCTDINEGGAQWYPNNIYSHCDVAFERYYEVKGAEGCNLDGAAYLVNCSTACQSCVTKPTTTDSQLYSALGYLCGGVGKASGYLGGLCEAILPNGTHYEPNTLRNHVDWATNKFYSINRCFQPVKSCDFGGATELIPCGQ